MTMLLLTPCLAEADALQGIFGPLLTLAIVLLGIRVMLRGLFPGRHRCSRCGCGCGCRSRCRRGWF